jgi:putative ABC transport system permease protein
MTAGPPGRSPSTPARRSGAGIIVLPPWTRAPLLPFRQPAVILAVLGAAAILACASSSAALFLSSASSESLRRLLAAQCAEAGFPTVRATGVVGDAARGVPASTLPIEARSVDDGAVRSAMRAQGLGDPARGLTSEQRPQVAAGALNLDGLLLYRDGATANVTRIGRSLPGPGVWLSRSYATRLGAGLGDSLRLTSDGDRGAGASVRVVGLYRDLFDEPARPYWCSYTTLFLGFGDDPPPPPMLATDVPTFERLRDGFGGSSIDLWVAPADLSAATLAQGRSIAERQEAAYRSLGLPLPAGLVERTSGTGQMPEFVKRTSLIRSGLRGPVLPIALGGSILALLLVGAAGSYWADRRAQEVRLLSSRGVGPAALALKAVLELAGPAVAGTVLGWLLARWLVAVLGPSPRVDSSAPWQAGLTALVAMLAGLALLALVAGLRSRSATERPVGARRGWVAVVPWELLVLGAALACWLALRGGDTVTVDAGVAQINSLVVAFPLLFLVGAAVLVVRLLALLLPRLGRAAGRMSPAWYLATRRVTASRVVSVVLLAAASAPIAMLVYAAALNQTSQYTLQTKAGIINGSRTAVQSVDPIRRTPATDAVGTVVYRYLYGVVPGQTGDVIVLAIDPDTFPATAYWDRRFADRPLDRLMAELKAPTADGRVPAVVVPYEGQEFAPDFPLGLGRTRIQIHTAGHAYYFPGRRENAPMIILDRSRLGPVDRYAGQLSELWSRDDDADRVQGAVSGQHARIYLVTSQDTTFDVANFLGVSWTFGYLSALAALVGLVAIGGLLLYLETRQRSRAASYALGKRMGLSRGTHLRSLLAELGVLLGLAWVIGAGLAWAAVLMVYGRLDIDPTRPPTPLLTAPTLAFAGSAVAVVVVVVLAALYAQRSADRADVSEVLRLGT